MSHAGEGGEAIFNLAIESGQAVEGVSGTGGVEVEHVAIAGLEAEVLMFEIAERLGHQDGAGHENQGQRCLKHDQRFLGETGPVAAAAIDAAKDFGRLGVGRQPCGRQSKQNADDE